jgi:hypothetical protein
MSGFLLGSNLPFVDRGVGEVISNENIDSNNAIRTTALCINVPTTEKDYQCDACVSIGKFAGKTEQSYGSVAVGYRAGSGDGYEINGPINDTTRQGAVACAIGAFTGYREQGAGSVACGYAAGYTGQRQCAVSIGFQSGQFNQGQNSIAIGLNAAADTQGSSSVAIGDKAGTESQGATSIAIGFNAAKGSQGVSSVAIGLNAGNTLQGAYSVAIGTDTGYNKQGIGSVLIGKNAGYSLQGENSIAIGFEAASSNLNRPQSGGPKGTIAIGAYSVTDQGEFAIAIGSNSTSTNNTQADKSIHINASGNHASQNIPKNSLTLTTGGKGGVYINSFNFKPSHPTVGVNRLVYHNSITNELYALNPSAG